MHVMGLSCVSDNRRKTNDVGINLLSQDKYITKNH